MHARQLGVPLQLAALTISRQIVGIWAIAVLTVCYTECRHLRRMYSCDEWENSLLKAI